MESIEKNPMNGLKDEFTNRTVKERKSKTFIVGEQVGWSLVSEYKIGNTYIERIGELQRE